MKIRHAGLLALLAAVLLPSTAGAVRPGTVAWMNEDFENGDSELYVARADGSTGAVALTRASDHDPAQCFEGSCGAGMPQWFHDGSRLIFDASWNVFVSLWTIRPDGAGATQLPQTNDIDGVPGISNDDSMVVFESTSLDGSAEGIYIRPLGSGIATRLTTDPPAYYDTNPDLSPDSSRVAFQRVYNNSERVEIWVMNADGTHLHRLLSSGRRWGDPYFSPDGSKILVQVYDERANQGRNSNEYVMNADGTNLRPVTHEPLGSFAFSGDWSPDGRHIVYARFRRGDEAISIRSMNINGNDEGKIADCDVVAFCDNPSWGVYEGPLPATPAARIRSARATPRRHLSRRAAAGRLHRKVVRELRRPGGSYPYGA
jgi:Tol biopolymer transport system component